MRRLALGLTALVLASVACASPIPPEPTARATPLATRIVRPPPTPGATAAAVTPSPTARVRRVFRDSDFDPYAALYVPEREGIYVTTRNRRGRYYYRWDDRRWMALPARVWFRSLEDLQTVFPGREGAP